MNKSTLELLWIKIFQITNEEQLKTELQSIDLSQSTNSHQNILHMACIEGKKDLINTIIEINLINGNNKLNINQQDTIKYWSPLFYLIDSCDNGLPDIVEILIKNGAMIDIIDSKKITPLHLAAFKGQDDNVDYLLKHNAKVNALDILGRMPLTYAIIEGQTNCVQALLEGGADINSLDVNNESLLYDCLFIFYRHYAVIGKGNGLFYASLLIEKGINIDVRNNEGNSALMLSAKKNPKENVRVIQLLLNAKAKIDIVNNNGESFYSILGNEAIKNNFNIITNDKDNKETKDFHCDINNPNTRRNNNDTNDLQHNLFIFLILPILMLWLSNYLMKITNLR